MKQPAKPALGTELLYSTCWEDAAVARRALRIPAGGRVVAIGAAGDNVLALLLDDPGQVIAVDVNPAQAALVELKAAAVRLSGEQLADFLGVGAGSGGHAPSRLLMYRRLRAVLTPPALAFWDRRLDLIAGGVAHAGRFERHVGRFRRLVLPLAPGRRTVEWMLAAQGVAEQALIYRQEWDSAAWRGLFRIAFSRRLLAALGRHPALFAQAPAIDVGRHYLERVEAGLTATPLRRNPYMTFALSGGYRYPDAAPDYLLPANRLPLAARADRLEVRVEPLLDTLRGLPDASVDAFYLSDIFELADETTYRATLAEIARVGRPGARLCYWNNLVERRRPEQMADRLAAQDELAADLFHSDRAFLYSRLIVEEVAVAPAARRLRVA